MKVSLITTERNEADSIAEFIESALDQSHKPDEIVIADGGSSDGTIEIIESYIKKGTAIRLIKAPGNRSVGRNAATKAAHNEVIAVTDVGCRLDKDWLKNITEPFRKNPNAMAVAGMYVPDPKSYFEKVSATLMYHENDDIDLDTWLPSGRSVAYKKAAWAKVGGYPEHTNFNEDTPFDINLKKAGFKFEDGLSAVVYWRPRPNLKEFYRQFYWYAVGDGLDKINFRSLRLLSVKYALILAALITPLVLQNWWLLLAALVGITFTYWLRVAPAWRKIRGIKAAILMMFLILVFHISQLLGFWKGYFFRGKYLNSHRLTR